MVLRALASGLGLGLLGFQALEFKWFQALEFK